MSILKPSYGASVAVTSTALQSLAYGGTGLVMWSSAVIDNTANLSYDEIITWQIKSGTSPTVGAVGECWLWEILDDTPTYPDTITGSEGAFTLTSFNVKYAGLFKFAGNIIFDATTGRVYCNSFRLSQAFGTPPKKWGIAFVNSSGVALSSSGNVVTRTPVQFQIV